MNIRIGRTPAAFVAAALTGLVIAWFVREAGGDRSPAAPESSARGEMTSFDAARPQQALARPVGPSEPVVDVDPEGSPTRDCGWADALQGLPPNPAGVRNLLLRDMTELSGCQDRIPLSWRSFAAEAWCSGAAMDSSVPAEWFLDAIEALNPRWLADGSDVARCLAGQSALSSAAFAGRLAAALSRATADLPRMLANAARPPSEELLALLREILEVRTPADAPWWESFWRGLGDDAAALRQHAYWAVGEIHGAEALWAFVDATMAWGAQDADAGLAAPRLAGGVLRHFFLDPSHPLVARLVPDSPRLRMALVYAVPLASTWPATSTPLFSNEATQRGVSQRLAALQASSDAWELAWAAAYVGNEWTIAGFDVAAARLGSTGPAVDPPESPLGPLDRAQFAAAVLAHTTAISSRTFADRAHVLRTQLQAILTRVSVPKLVALARTCRSLPPEGTQLVAAMMQERRHELPVDLQAHFYE